MRFASAQFRIGEGGPLRRFENKTHLTSLPLQICTLLAVTWVPLVLFGAVSERLTGHREQLIHNGSMYVRLLVAAPVFLISDRLFPRVCAFTLWQLSSQPFIPEKDHLRFDGLIRAATRLADLTLPELLLALLSFGIGLGALFGVIPISGLTHRTDLTAAQLWYALADWPIFQFLLWRSLWRWAIWVRVLVGLSRIRLDLVPTHPDRCGGIGFLRLPSVGYCAMLLFAASSVLCAEYGDRFVFGKPVASFKMLLLLFAIVALVIAFGPLLLFASQLARCQRRGLVEFGELAAERGRMFRGKIEARDHPSVHEISPLNDLTEVYRGTVDRIRLLLFDGRDLIVLLVATLLPVLPVMLLNIPRDDWQELIGLITGGRL